MGTLAIIVVKIMGAWSRKTKENGEDGG